MSLFLQPSDWETVGPRPEVIFDWPHASTPTVRFTQQTSLIRRLTREVTDVSAAPTGNGGTWAAQPDEPLGPGPFVVSIHADGTKHAEIGLVVDPDRGLWAHTYEAILAARLPRSRAIAAALPAAGDTPLFSIQTTVYDTPPTFLHELAACLRAQCTGDYEWLLLDNGSTDAATIEAVQEIAAADDRVHTWRVDDNLHIIGGNRYVLERARGRYVAPVDSDDVLTPDALTLLADAAVRNDWPGLLFTDEHKISALGHALEPMYRPAWSSIEAIETCPASHLMAFDRETALAAGAYTEDTARGCHDWDTFLRLTDAGIVPRHVPHVTYGWRVHPASCAMATGAKDYILDSHSATIEASLVRRGIADRFEVVPAHEAHLGYYHVRRRQETARPVCVDHVLRDAEAFDALAASIAITEYPELHARIVALADAVTEATRLEDLGVEVVVVPDDAALVEALAACPDTAFCKMFVEDHVRLTEAAWVWDVVGTFELDAAIGIVGGKILDAEGNVAHVGHMAGLDGFVNTPSHGQPPEHVWHAGAFVRRPITAAHTGLIAIRRETLAAHGAPIGVDGDDGLCGVEYALRCRPEWRAAFTPEFAGQRARPIAAEVGVGHPLRAILRRDHAKALALDPSYSAWLEPTGARYGAIAAVEGIAERPAE